MGLRKLKPYLGNCNIIGCWERAYLFLLNETTKTKTETQDSHRLASIGIVLNYLLFHHSNNLQTLYLVFQYYT